MTFDRAQATSLPLDEVDDGQHPASEPVEVEQPVPHPVSAQPPRVRG